MNKAVIFDMDGTVWDASKQVTDSWNMVFKKYPNADEITIEDMQSCMGLMMDEIEYLSTHCGELFEGLESTLKALKDMGYKLMIVTNGQDGFVQAFLKGSGLSYLFEDYEMFGRTTFSKCENIRLVAERNYIEKAVYVGDTYWDYLSTVAAGYPFIHAAYGFGKVEQAEYRINKLSELVTLVPQIIG